MAKSSLEQRKRRGAETTKRYRALHGDDCYSCAVDAIADILLSTAQTEEEATQILQAAEVDFRNAAELETFFAEG
jgi:cytidylate kinase